MAAPGTSEGFGRDYEPHPGKTISPAAAEPEDVVVAALGVGFIIPPLTGAAIQLGADPRFRMRSRGDWKCLRFGIVSASWDRLGGQVERAFGEVSREVIPLVVEQNAAQV